MFINPRPNLILGQCLVVPSPFPYLKSDHNFASASIPDFLWNLSHLTHWPPGLGSNTENYKNIYQTYILSYYCEFNVVSQQESSHFRKQLKFPHTTMSHQYHTILQCSFLNVECKFLHSCGMYHFHIILKIIMSTGTVLLKS
jgi:hypothetical protein